MQEPNADDQRRLLQLIRRMPTPRPPRRATPGSGRAPRRLDSTPGTASYSGTPSDARVSGFGARRAPDDPGRRRQRHGPRRHDAFARPRLIAVAAVPQRQPSYTATATVETGEPTPTCAGVGETVWFRYAAARAGTLHRRHHRQRLRHSWPPRTAAPPLDRRSVQVACNDDIDLASPRRSRPQFAATAGQTYYLQVGGFAAPSGAVGRRHADPRR